jgi:hypothetical protein
LKERAIASRLFGGSWVQFQIAFAKLEVAKPVNSLINPGVLKIKLGSLMLEEQGTSASSENARLFEDWKVIPGRQVKITNLSPTYLLVR